MSQKELDEEYLRGEVASFHALANEGGRPPFPLHLVETLFWHPEQGLKQEEYRDIILHFQLLSGTGSRRICVCECQLRRWREVQRTQRIIRKRNVVSEAVLIHAAVYDSWEQYADAVDPRTEEGSFGFAEYAKLVKSRVVKSGWTRPFELHKDADAQDKLIEWLEYLALEYKAYDEATDYVMRHQARVDRTWDKLVQSQLLREGGTYETICDVATTFRDMAEADRAAENVRLAEEAVAATKLALANSGGAEDAIRAQLSKQLSMLNGAKAAQEALIPRTKAISASLEKILRFRREKSQAGLFHPLIQWMKQQLPVIELELQSAGGSAQNSKGASHRSKNVNLKDPTIQDRKSPLGEGDPQEPSESEERNHALHDPLEDDRPPEQAKPNKSDNVVHSGTADIDATSPMRMASSAAPLTKESAVSRKANGLQAAQQLRRSTRIAEARQKAARTADATSSRHPATKEPVNGSKPATQRRKRISGPESVIKRRKVNHKKKG